MKAFPKYDVTKQGNFAMWESGLWLPRTSGGFSVLVAGPNGEKLPVIFDRSAGIHRYLMPITLGSMYVTATVEKSGPEEYRTKVCVYRITSLLRTADNKPEVEGEVLLEMSKMLTEEELLDPSFLEVPGHKELICAAIEKARTWEQQQRLFWGVPRVREDV